MFSRAIKPCAFAAVVLLCLTGTLPSCSDTTDDPEPSPAREQTLRKYASLMYTCAEDLVYGLDNLFQANWYAKASGDPALQQEIRRKYFSVAELEYDEAAGTIWVNKWRGKSFRITTGGAALDAVGTVWHVEGTQSRPWPDYTPESFLFTVTCLAENSYRITGDFISNRLFEEKFIYSELEADFGTGTAYTGFYGTTADLESAGREERAMVTYRFDGRLDSYMGLSGMRDEASPAFACTLKSLYGYDNLEYIGSEPIYDGRKFFDSGEISGSFTAADGTATRMEVRVRPDTRWSVTSDNLGTLEEY